MSTITHHALSPRKASTVIAVSRVLRRDGSWHESRARRCWRPQAVSRQLRCKTGPAPSAAHGALTMPIAGWQWLCGFDLLNRSKYSGGACKDASGPRKGLKPTCLAASSRTFFQPDVRTAGALMKGGRSVDRSETAAAHSSPPPQPPASQRPSQGSGQGRHGHVDHRWAVQDCPALRISELAQAQGASRVPRRARTDPTRERHQ